MNDITERSAGFGSLGQVLVGELARFPALVEEYSQTSFLPRLVRLQGTRSALKRHGPLVAPAVSLLCMDYPFQMDMSPNEVLTLALHSFDFSFVQNCRLEHGGRGLCAGKRGYYRKLAMLACNDKDFRHEVFPRKKFSAASTKVNVRFAALSRELMRRDGAASLGRRLSLLPAGTSRDVASTYLLYSDVLAHHFGPRGCEIAAAAIRSPKDAKGLSNAIKALGQNSSMPGCLFVEADVLQGRGTGAIDWAEEVLRRTDPGLVAEQVVEAGPNLREHVRAIIARELPDGGELPDLDEWWTSRWTWCVNGSENSTSDSLLFGKTPRPRDGLGTERYRRMAAEELTDNPVPDWDCKVIATPSSKLECGKTRAIFACDTKSYFAFSWLLGAVQKVWRNDRVLLDPGRGGMVGVSRRIQHAMSGGGVSVMLDYDDFNSQHTNDAMVIVIEELCRSMNAPSWYASKLTASVHNLWIKSGGEERLVAGTLMSGHRGTTVWNSILNAAYIRQAIGGAFFDRVLSLHTGDDVYMRLNTLQDAVSVLRACAELGCRMNPTKQSIGFKRAEFLRLGIGPSQSFGYIARSIASTVAGNWVSGESEDLEAKVNAMIASSRSLANRAGYSGLGPLIARSVEPFLNMSRKISTALLNHTVAIEGSPVYNTGFRISTVSIRRPDEVRAVPGNDWGQHATLSYLANHLDPVEVAAIEKHGSAPVAAMLESSYKKGRLHGPRREQRIVSLSRVKTRVALGGMTTADLSQRHTERGKLAAMPVLQLLGDSLSDDDIRELLSMTGVSVPAPEARAVAFGDPSHSCVIHGNIPYSDAAAFSKRTGSDCIYVTSNVNM